jgi:hypothetical protein
MFRCLFLWVGQLKTASSALLRVTRGRQKNVSDGMFCAFVAGSRGDSVRPAELMSVCHAKLRYFLRLSTGMSQPCCKRRDLSLSIAG